MSASERGIHWEDEGCLYVDQSGSWPRLETTQYERTLQDDYCAGALVDGIRCRVNIHHFKSRGGTRPQYYRTEITGIQSIAAELFLHAKCGVPRSERKRNQLRKFPKSLEKQGKLRRRSYLAAVELASRIEHELARGSSKAF